MGEGCVDIDEWETGTHDCFHFKDSNMYTGQELMNTKHSCGLVWERCKILFKECFNTDGSYTCDCIDGWAETVTDEHGKKCELILRHVFDSYKQLQFTYFS